jgi:osmotically-inducible protein OsmY
MSKLCIALAALAIGGFGHLALAADAPMAAQPPQSAPDNSARNARDRDGSTLTSGDQSENEVDRALTQKIRKAVVADDALSIMAKNVKIITVDGMVTLRGPVQSASERTTIAEIATTAAGTAHVHDQLEIVTPE